MKFNTYEDFEKEFNCKFKLSDYKEDIENLLNTYYNKNVGFNYEDILKITVMCKKNKGEIL